jgi:Cu-Zn family superoxide dismutase
MMRKVLLCAAAVSLLAFSAHAATQQKAVAKFVDINGRPAGTATFTNTRHGVLVDVKVTGLNEGVHGIHIHTSGNCDVKTRFTAAGPHFSFGPKEHGFMAAKGMHAGDLPNGYAAHDGTLEASFITNAFTLGNGKKSIFDKDGASIVVHAKADDYRSQPSGNTGDRVACGVIVRTAGPAPRHRPGKTH